MNNNAWKALPWALSTACSECGQLAYCHGPTRDRVVCLDCFTNDHDVAKLRRSGKPGKRSTYTYRVRRSKTDQIQRARTLRVAGYSISQIHFELGVSKRTVSNYLSMPLPGPQSRSSSGVDVTRKEDRG